MNQGVLHKIFLHQLIKKKKNYTIHPSSPWILSFFKEDNNVDIYSLVIYVIVIWLSSFDTKLGKYDVSFKISVVLALSGSLYID